MSTLIVPVAQIENIKPHPNAVALTIAEVLGWQVVIKLDQFKVGDLVVYFPPDTVLPLAQSDALGVTQYLSKGRVRSIALRGEPSHGFVVPAQAGDVLGDNVADRYGATKYEPPVKVSAGDADTEDPDFQKYTNIENLRNFPNVFKDGEDVWVTEKIHGTNCRAGLVKGVWMAGSHELRRKEPVDRKSNIYWFPLTNDNLRNLLVSLAGEAHSATVYAEVYGSRVQGANFAYDAGDALGFRVFDICVDGKYMSTAELDYCCEHWNVPQVPVLYRGEYSLDVVKRLANESSALGKVREGVVIKPVVERTDPRIGRVVLKYISDAFLLKQSADRDKGRDETAH